jgi:hypothetical protein
MNTICYTTNCFVLRHHLLCATPPAQRSVSFAWPYQRYDGASRKCEKKTKFQLMAKIVVCHENKSLRLCINYSGSDEKLVTRSSVWMLMMVLLAEWIILFVIWLNFER